MEGDGSRSHGPVRRLFLDDHGGSVTQKHFPVWFRHILVCAKRVPVTKKKKDNLVNSLVLWAQSTTKDYIRAKKKLQSVSWLFGTHVIKAQNL